MSELEKAVDAGVELAKLGYTDALQPAAQVGGRALATTVKAASIALEPLAGLVWSYETLKGALLEWLAPHLTVVPPERIRTPSPVVAVPVIQALAYTASETYLREMYVRLLATSMDDETAKSAHPGFVEIIKQLTPDEGAMLPLLATSKYHPLVTLRHKPTGKSGSRANRPNSTNLAELAGCKFPELASEYVANLQRLGIVQVKHDGYVVGQKFYDPIEDMPGIAEVLSDYAHYGNKPELERHYLEVTSFGLMFLEVVLGPDNVSDSQEINIEIPITLSIG